MGWKNVKEHYRIAHQVQVCAGRICIGSSYISEIIVIGADGTLEKRYDGRVIEDLVRYQREMEADPAQLRRLIEAPDTFSASLRVYTYEGGEIIEKFCECLGWPNVTHDGQMMYENTFSADREKVLAWARRNAELELEAALGNVREIEEKLEEKRAWAAQAQAAVEKLKDAHA